MVLAGLAALCLLLRLLPAAPLLLCCFATPVLLLGCLWAAAEIVGAVLGLLLAYFWAGLSGLLLIWLPAARCCSCAAAALPLSWALRAAADLAPWAPWACAAGSEAAGTNGGRHG